MKTVGYLRVITANQDLEKNRSGIALFANENRLVPVECVEEEVSGTKHRKDYRGR